MDYNKLVAVTSVYASQGWSTVDSHGLLCKMRCNDDGKKVLFQVMEGDKVNLNGEAILTSGETIEFVGKIRLKGFNDEPASVRFLLYDKA